MTFLNPFGWKMLLSLLLISSQKLGLSCFARIPKEDVGQYLPTTFTTLTCVSGPQITVEGFWQISLTTFMPVINLTINRGNKRCQTLLTSFQIASCKNGMKFVTRSIIEYKESTCSWLEIRLRLVNDWDYSGCEFHSMTKEQMGI